jgi:ring-1,2-phenylacetyl-CoA epoxidase subunit PaaD
LTTDWIAPARARASARLWHRPAGRTCRDAQSIGGCATCGDHRLSARGSTRTQELSRFGSTPCKAQYRCEDCREPFDYFKPH